MSDDAIRLRLFPFSLKYKAKHWLNSEPPDSITSWDSLVHKFLLKIFPPKKATRMRIEIHNFAQYEGETFYKACDHYKDLLRKCPHHGLEKWMQVHHFYNELTGTIRTLIDALVGGALMSKSANEAHKLLEDTLNNCRWPRERETPKKPSGVHELDVSNNLAIQVSLLTKQLQSTQLQNTQVVVNVIQGTIPTCDFYDEIVILVGDEVKLCF